MPKLDFAAINADALANINILLHNWLPDGKQNGREYLARNPNRVDNNHGAFSINTNNGLWADFSTDDKGSGMVALCKYLFDLKPRDAALKVVDDLGSMKERYESETPFDLKLRKKLNNSDDSPWKWFAGTKTVPETFEHYEMGKPDVIYTYNNFIGDLIGYVCRWNDVGGKKEIRPYHYFKHITTGDSRWIFRQMPKPRPLYNLPSLQRDTFPVLVVEGEKAADAAIRLVGDQFNVLSWSGGCNAVDKMQWERLRKYKCDMFIWPDADDAGLHGSAAVRLQVRKCRPIDFPSDVAKGWDLADAEEEGWTGDRVIQYINDNCRPESKFPEDGKGRHLQMTKNGMMLSNFWKGKVNREQ